MDTIAKALNEIMNAKKGGKEICAVGPISKMLVAILEIMKKNGYISYIRASNSNYGRLLCSG